MSGTDGDGHLPPAQSARFPAWVEPELATLTRDRFSDPGWIFERKLDGERCLAFREGSAVRLMTRNKKEISTSYPELASAVAAQAAIDYLFERLGGHGGIILLGPDGLVGLAHNTPRMAWGLQNSTGAKWGVTRRA